VDSTVYLYTPNDPIIEASSNLMFAPYNLKYPLLHSHSIEANIIGEFKDEENETQTKVNKWNLIFDFDKAKKDSL
jgi:hypothetical protein